MNIEERKDLADKILDHLAAKGAKFLAQNKLRYAGLPVNMKRKGWLANLDKSFFRDGGPSEFLLLDEHHQEDIEIIVKEFAYEDDKEEVLDMYRGGEVPMIRVPRENLIPVFNVESEKEEVLIIDKNTGRLSELSYQAWFRGLDREKRNLIVEDTFRDAKFLYDPYNVKPFYKGMLENGQEVLVVNMYQPPEWRLRPVENPENIECPKIIREFYEHLFPDDFVRTLAIHWDHTALIGRNETAKVLNAAKGIGKGIYHELLSAVVGQENSDIVPESFFKSDFNSILLNRRLLLVDEKRISKSEHTRLKRYLNDTQNIEKKGVDVRSKQKTYNNFLITCNDVSDMYLEIDDRRFTVLETTETPLNKVWSEEKIASFLRRIKEDEDMIRDFGYWLLYRGKLTDWGETDVYKGPHFYNLAYNSLAAWQKFIHDKIVEEGMPVYSIKQLRKEFKREEVGKYRLPATAKVEDFLKNYLYNGEKRLGRVVSGEDGPEIRVNQEFVKEDFSLFTELSNESVNQIEDIL